MESFNQNVIKHKTGLLNLAAELGNISKACKVMGFSRDAFYRYQTARDAGGVEALFEVSRKKPNLKNRVEEATETAVTAFAIDFPAHGQVRVSICTCGGITEVKKICDMAHVYDVTVQIHVCGGPISNAAALHMEAAIPNFIIHELHRYSLLEANTKSCKYNYLPKNGMYTVPELPGLGQELTEESFKASTVITVK